MCVCIYVYVYVCMYMCVCICVYINRSAFPFFHLLLFSPSFYSLFHSLLISFSFGGKIQIENSPSFEQSSEKNRTSNYVKNFSMKIFNKEFEMKTFDLFFLSETNLISSILLYFELDD